MMQSIRARIVTTLVVAVAALVSAVAVSAASGPPTSAGRPAGTGAAVAGKALTALPGSWQGTQPIAFAYQWSRCSSTGSACVNIPEAAQSAEYVLTSDDLGHRLRVTIAASNSAGRNTRDSAASAIVRAAPTNAPVDTTRPAVSGTPLEGNTLTGSNGAWNGATPTFAYQWQRCDTAGAGCADILGAKSQTYSPTSLDVGNTLRIVVTATNANGSGASISHQTSAIRSASSVQVSLSSSVKVVNYGGSVALTGTVAGASAGDAVTIMARPGLNRSLQTVGSTTTDGNGSFTKTVTPRMRTVYAAKGDGATSDGLAISVRPSLRMSHAAGGQLAVRLTAARSFVGRYVTVQAFARRRWTAVKRVFLTHRSFGSSPTIFSTARFHLSVRHGLKLRALLTLSQSGPTYASAKSNIVRR
jgi:hypothetical protein